MVDASVQTLLSKLHRLAGRRRLIRSKHDFVGARGVSEAGEGHFFAGGQRGEEGLELCGVGMI